MTGGPLDGVRVVEMAGIGPGPHGAMMLSDLGADVVRVERPAGGLDLTGGKPDWLLRGRRSVAADLKDPAGVEFVLSLVAKADVLIEGYRPGVAERLGIGPEACAATNPGLVYARITGWGQHGPRAATAGHDINYLAVSGGLHAIGPADGAPVVPLNLVADIAGGSMVLVAGVLAALVERSRTGRGQVVDAAMVDGTSIVLQMVWSLLGAGTWRDERGANLLDGSCPFYGVYRCADGRHIAVGALEAEFYSRFVTGLGLDPERLPSRDDRRNWPALRARFAAVVGTRSRDDWAVVFEQTDACVTPVLQFAEAPFDPHLAARGSLVEIGGAWQAAPAPRFSAHPSQVPAPPRPAGADRDEVLADWGVPVP